MKTHQQNWRNNKIHHTQNAKDITDTEYVFLVLVILSGCWAKVIYSEINSMIIQMILFFNALKMSFKYVKFKNFSVVETIDYRKIYLPN